MEPWKLVVALGFVLGACLLVGGGTACLALHLGWLSEILCSAWAALTPDTDGSGDEWLTASPWRPEQPA
jgi:hypothetical protein